MSALKSEEVGGSIGTLSGQWLLENLRELSAAIVARAFASNPSLKQKYGNSGRNKCEEDAMYHLHFLCGALALDSVKVFIDYVGWAKIVLHSRGIAVADLALTLDCMRVVLHRKAPRKLAALLCEFVNAASSALPTLPENAPALIDAKAPYAELANSYLNSLLVFKRDEAMASLVRVLEAGLTFRDLFEYVLSPVQKQVGRLWQEKRITVVQEHYCTVATDMLLISYRRKFLGTRRNVSAVAVCADGEEHCLGLKMFSDILESDGWNISYMGSKCPNSAVLDYLHKNKTDLVAISVTTPLHLTSTKQLIADIKALPRAYKPAVLIGGAVLNSESELWKRTGADGWGATVLDGLEVANRLVGEKH